MQLPLLLLLFLLQEEEKIKWKKNKSPVAIWIANIQKQNEEEKLTPFTSHFNMFSRYMGMDFVSLSQINFTLIDARNQFKIKFSPKGETKSEKLGKREELSTWLKVQIK